MSCSRLLSKDHHLVVPPATLVPNYGQLFRDMLDTELLKSNSVALVYEGDRVDPEEILVPFGKDFPKSAYRVDQINCSNVEDTKDKAAKTVSRLMSPMNHNGLMIVTVGSQCLIEFVFEQVRANENNPLT